MPGQIVTRYTPPPTELPPEARRRVRAWFESNWPTFCASDPAALRRWLRIQWEEFRAYCEAKQPRYKNYEAAFRQSLIRAMAKYPSGRDPISPAPNRKGNRPFETNRDVKQLDFMERP